jgi:hypothetical protein
MSEQISEVAVEPPITPTFHPSQLPEVELPKVGRILSDFAREIGEVMRLSGVFLQDGLPVVLDPGTDRLSPLIPACLRTYVEGYLRTVKMVKMPWKNPDGSDAYESRPDSMNKMQAEAVLMSHMFLILIRPLRRISRISIPIFRDGELTLQGPGYDATTKILVKE